MGSSGASAFSTLTIEVTKESGIDISSKNPTSLAWNSLRSGGQGNDDDTGYG